MNKKILYGLVFTVLFFALILPDTLNPNKGIVFTFEEWIGVLSLLLGVILFQKPIAKINQKLNQLYPWKSAAIRRIFIQFGLMAIAAAVISLFVYLPASYYLKTYGVPTFYQEIIDEKEARNARNDGPEDRRNRPNEPWQFSDFMVGVAGISFFCFLLIFVVEETYGYLHLQSQKRIEFETLLKEQAQLRANALKKQLDPHFMFNSLNVLSGLIYQDVDKSAQFIKELSKVYRYVLEQSEELVSTIAQEFTFLDSYMYLLKIRFEDKIPLSIEIPEDRKDWLIPSMTLELLVENAIKHNVFDRERPLYLDFRIENDQLIVKNNLQPRNNLTESMGLGLQNLKTRMELLGLKHYRFSEVGNEFVAVVPLINPAHV